MIQAKPAKESSSLLKDRSNGACLLVRPAARGVASLKANLGELPCRPCPHSPSTCSEGSGLLLPQTPTSTEVGSYLISLALHTMSNVLP